MSTKKSQGTAETSGVTEHESTSDAASYWTPERMASATPKDITVPGGDASQGTEDSGIRSAPTP
jgi:hypothetical protein